MPSLMGRGKGERERGLVEISQDHPNESMQGCFCRACQPPSLEIADTGRQAGAWGLLGGRKGGCRRALAQAADSRRQDGGQLGARRPVGLERGAHLILPGLSCVASTS